MKFSKPKIMEIIRKKNEGGTTYQARKLDTKVVYKDGTRKTMHTLNNTALATSRIMVAILENFQTKQGTIKIPKALWPYMTEIKEIRMK